MKRWQARECEALVSAHWRREALWILRVLLYVFAAGTLTLAIGRAM